MSNLLDNMDDLTNAEIVALHDLAISTRSKWPAFYDKMKKSVLGRLSFSKFSENSVMVMELISLYKKIYPELNDISIGLSEELEKNMKIPMEKGANFYIVPIGSYRNAHKSAVLCDHNNKIIYIVDSINDLDAIDLLNFILSPYKYKGYEIVIVSLIRRQADDHSCTIICLADIHAISIIGLDKMNEMVNCLGVKDDKNPEFIPAQMLFYMQSISRLNLVNEINQCFSEGSLDKVKMKMQGLLQLREKDPVHDKYKIKIIKYYQKKL